MGKSTKIQQLRERMQIAARQSQQMKLDNPTNVHEEPAKEFTSEPRKQITIAEIITETKENELALKVAFHLLPSRRAFSKIWSDLYFDAQKLETICISIPQGSLATNDFEFTPVLDMRGIKAGGYAVKVEMYELWSSGERLTCASKEVVVEYIPKVLEDRLIEVPTVKRTAGVGLVVLSEYEKGIYRQIEKNRKEELLSKRDEK
jgi:hypothetical protein